MNAIRYEEINSNKSMRQFLSDRVEYMKLMGMKRMDIPVYFSRSLKGRLYIKQVKGGLIQDIEIDHGYIDKLDIRQEVCSITVKKDCKIKEMNVYRNGWVGGIKDMQTYRAEVVNIYIGGNVSLADMELMLMLWFESGEINVFIHKDLESVYRKDLRDYSSTDTLCNKILRMMQGVNPEVRKVEFRDYDRTESV